MSETVQIPKGWELKKISQLCTVVRGGSPRPKGDPLYFGGSIPWIMISDATRNKGKFLKETKEGLTEAGVPKSRFLKSETLILTNSATICLPKILKIDGCIHDGFLAFLNLKEIERDFLYYFFLAYRTKITETIARGMAQKNLNIDLVSNIDILLPPIPTQKKIVQKLDDILGQLEEKKKEIFSIIEQNTQRIDFFEKNWISYLIDREIEHHAKRNEWKLEKLGDVSQLITKGSSPKWQGIRYVENGILFITSKNVGNGRLILKQKQYVETKFNKIQKRSILKKGDLLTNIVGAGIGRSALFDLEENANINQAVALIRLNNNIDNKFILYVLNSPKTLKFMQSDKKENARPNLSLAQVGSILIPLPPLQIQKQIVQNIKSAEEKFQSQKVQFENIKQNYENTINHINHIQSSILDAAFSGKLVK